MPPETVTSPAPAAPAADSTLISTPPTSSTTGGSSTDVGGVPKATPEGSTLVATPAASGTPAGSSQDPTPAPNADGKPAQAQDGQPKPPAASEGYQPFKVPEGVILDPTITKDFETVAKEMNLSQEQAQKLVDLQSKIADQATKDSVAQFKQMTDSWRQESLKELGPDANKQLALAAQAREKFGTPDLVQVLDQSGLGNHPAIVKFFVAIGKAISEDSFPEGKTIAAGDKTAAEILYPNLAKK